MSSMDSSGSLASWLLFHDKPAQAEPQIRVVTLDGRGDPGSTAAVEYLHRTARHKLDHEEDVYFLSLLDAAAGAPITFDPTQSFAPLAAALKGPVSAFISNFDLLDLDLRRTWDPVTRRELIVNGYMGEISYTEVDLDGPHCPLHLSARLPLGTVYAVAEPEKLGRYHVAQSQVVPQGVPHTWIWEHTVLMEVFSGGVVKGIWQGEASHG